MKDSRITLMGLVDAREEVDDVEGWQEVVDSSFELSTSSRGRTSFSSLSVTLLDLTENQKIN